MVSSTATVQAGDDGPNFEIATRGLGFSWEGSGPRDADTPKRAVFALSDQDIGNRPQIECSTAPKVPGSALVVGPVGRDEHGLPHVLCFSRIVAGVTCEHRTRVSLVVVPVMRGWTAESWRQAMVDEAKRHEPRHGPVHFWQVKQVERFEALANVLYQTFGADGRGWAHALEYIVEHGLRLDPTGEA